LCVSRHLPCPPFASIEIEQTRKNPSIASVYIPTKLSIRHLSMQFFPSRSSLGTKESPCDSISRRHSHRFTSCSWRCAFSRALTRERTPFARVRSCFRTCMCVQICTLNCTCDSYVHIRYLCVYRYTCINAYRYICTFTIYIFTYRYTYMYVYVYTCIYTMGRYAYIGGTDAR